MNDPQEHATQGMGPAQPGERAVLEIAGLTKSYQDPAHPALDRFSLRVERGETVALLGPSGCGKTTLLRLIAGFEAPDEGRVRVAGRDVTGPDVFVPPEARRIGFVFQDYALFPHLDVLGNVAFGLTGRSAAERRARAREVLDLVGLTVFSGRYPGQLSGGQQQRVALARALAPEPEVILLDEPFSNLDAALRAGTREEVRRILRRSGATTILVTHDQEEAMTFSDRLAVMRAGRLEQEGTPEETYLAPRTAFVAGFLGRTNLLRGEAHGITAGTCLGEIPLAHEAKGPVLVSLRPEELDLRPRGDGSVPDTPSEGPPPRHGWGIPVVVRARTFQGHDLLFRCAPDESHPVDDGDEAFLVRSGPGSPLRVGDRAYLQVRGRAVPLESSRS
ncbi:MAG: ABC transporter ATP-binding protein [Trueperaceae bacterium]|nr:ABC transporter ATP-binding protein [Trueperaceae bacterium]